MTWREELLDGALNGVPIHVTSRGFSGGRKTHVHEFSGRDDSWSEDTGILPRRWKTQFVVIGDDYFIDRDRVIAVLESPGPYTYTDPYMGEFQVALDGEFSCEEQGDGVAEFSCSFHRAGTLDFPIIADPTAEVQRVAKVALEAIEVSHADRFTLGKLIAAIGRGLAKANTALRVANGKIQQKLGIVGNLTNQLTQMQDSLGDLINSPQAFANTFRGLAAQIVSLVTTWADNKVDKIPDGAGNDNGDRVGIDVLQEVMGDFFAFDATEDENIDTTTPDGVQERDNLLAINAMVTQVMFAEISSQLATLVPDTAQKTDETKDQFVEVADGLLEDEEIGDDVFDAISDVIAGFVNYQVTVGKDLPNERVINAASGTPACVLAQIHYADGNRDIDVIRRNNIPHPLFASGEVRITDA